MAFIVARDGEEFNLYTLQSPLVAAQNTLTTTARVSILNARDRDVYTVLHRLALEKAALEHGLTRAQLAAFQTLSLPGELLEAHTGLTTGTLYRSLDRLEGVGLIARAALFGTLRGQSVKAGTLFSVVLNPARDHTARIPYGQFKAHRRNLDREVKQGHTAWAELKKYRTARVESQLVPAGEAGLLTQEAPRPVLSFQVLRQWAVTPVSQKSPVIPDSPSAPKRYFDLFALHDVVLCKLEDRAALVDEWARGLAAQLGDKSLDVWRWLAWNLTRAREQGQDYISFVLDAISRARTDHREGFARSAGALLVKRLREAGIWDALNQIPPSRVAASPHS